MEWLLDEPEWMARLPHYKYKDTQLATETPEFRNCFHGRVLAGSPSPEAATRVILMVPIGYTIWHPGLNNRAWFSRLQSRIDTLVNHQVVPQYADFLSRRTYLYRLDLVCGADGQTP